ncbi:MAG TPA: glycine--tRNA ligase [Candidatus Wildermuthbacteria bacterium]|nr:glycine--tRNA ligase [Candidatus Wildermuthbacteria bacterium]
MQKIVSLAKRRGFIFPSSEIYGGVEALWDYGPLGALLKNNIKKEWLKTFVQGMDNVALIDGSVLMHPDVWKVSGHEENFTDALVECKGCHSRFRADHMEDGRFIGEGKAKVKNQCPNCSKKAFTAPKNFNLMFKTYLGPVENEKNITYLRPETAQSMFTNFKSVQESMRFKIPFGIAQVGKSFRNEITTGNFTFRSREFDIAEVEYFVAPEDADKDFDIWVKRWEKFFLDMGLKKKNLRRYEHPKKNLAHYSKRTVDIEYKFPFGWAELAGIANRGDFDLKQHAEGSGQDLQYFDEAANKRYYPYVIEPTLGIERLLLALLIDAYEEVKGGRTTTTQSAKEAEIMLKLNKKLAPIQVAVFPLVKNKPDLVKKAKEVADLLRERFEIQYDESGAIGRRYRRQDEIGTPYAITVDIESLKNNDVTLRDRDTMKQERVLIAELVETLTARFDA